MMILAKSYAWRATSPVSSCVGTSRVRSAARVPVRWRGPCLKEAFRHGWWLHFGPTLQPVYAARAAGRGDGGRDSIEQ
eukprot:2474040-Lingulodinium_polyedra.AAC.1